MTPETAGTPLPRPALSATAPPSPTLPSRGHSSRTGSNTENDSLSGWIRTCIRHFSAIVFLQSRVVANRWSRESILGKVVVLIFYSAISMGTLFAVLIGSIGGFFLYRNASSMNYTSYVWNGLVFVFLLFWIIEISTELTRSDGVSMDRIMHLPISPSHVFSLNYILSMGNLPFIYFTCICIGLILGGSISHGPSVLLIAIPLLAYLVMITALTSHLRSILSAWVANPKRRRMVMLFLPFIVGITMAGVAISISQLTSYVARITKPNPHGVLPPPPTVLPDSSLPSIAPIPSIEGNLDDSKIEQSTTDNSIVTDTPVERDTPEASPEAPIPANSMATDSMAEVPTASSSSKALPVDTPPATDTSWQESAAPFRAESFTEFTGVLDQALSWLDITLPPFWFAACAESIPKSPWKTLFLVPGMLAISAVSLRRNYATTLRYYQHGFGSDPGFSQPKAESTSPTATNQAISTAGLQEGTKGSSTWMERSFPMLDETSSAIVAQSWISIWRAPEMKLQLMGPFIQPIILLFVMSYWRSSANPFLDTFLVLGIAGFCLYTSSGFLGNLFGFDRSGFRAWVLSPIPRHQILNGRNVAYGIPVFAIAGLTCIGIGIYWRIPLDKLLYSPLAIITFIPVCFLVTNLQSILAPFGLPAGGIQPKRFNWRAIVMTLLLSTLIPALFCVSLAPLGIEFLVSRFAPAMARVPLALLLSIPWAFGSWSLYRALILPMGRLLEHFELKVLEVVTSEVE